MIGVGMSLILGNVVKTDPYEHLPFTIGNTFLVSSWLTTLFAVVAGTLLFTSEVQHGTLAGALTARPSKPIIVGAKAFIAAVLGFAMGALGIVGGLVGGLASGMDTGDMSGAVSGVAWALVLTTLASVLGLGVGLIVRHSAAAVTSVLVWALAVETLVRGMRSRHRLPAAAVHRRPRPARHPFRRRHARDPCRRPVQRRQRGGHRVLGRRRRGHRHRPADPPGLVMERFAAFRHGNFRRYFVGQVISSVGSWLQALAVTWLVLDLTGRSDRLGIAVALQFLPLLAPRCTGRRARRQGRQPPAAADDVSRVGSRWRWCSVSSCRPGPRPVGDLRPHLPVRSGAGGRASGDAGTAVPARRT